MTCRVERKTMFEITMLPAREGDSLLIRYGPDDAPYRVLIDVGRKATYKDLLDLLPKGERHLELLVITHIDRDHIEGALSLLKDEDAGFSYDDIWFNGYKHLIWSNDESFGGVQGDKLTKLIAAHVLPWNKAFDGGPVRLDDDMPITRTLAGGLKLTLLSPTAEKLAKLEPHWAEECRRAGIDPNGAAIALARPSAVDDVETFGGSLEEMAATVTTEDNAPANGSSIAFLAEYDGKTVLFGADAHPSLLVASLDKLGRPLPLDCALVKVPHHGSQANTTRELLNRLTSPHWFISTNGSYFDHPDEVAIARILTSPASEQRTLHFNYKKPRTQIWQDKNSAREKYRYDCNYPEAGLVTLPL
jgi:beta-lactamase superfamily II metal-dependent hydrolase